MSHNVICQSFLTNTGNAKVCLGTQRNLVSITFSEAIINILFFSAAFSRLGLRRFTLDADVKFKMCASWSTLRSFKYIDSKKPVKKYNKYVGWVIYK